MAHQARETLHPEKHTMRRIYFCFLILTIFGLNLIPCCQARDSPSHEAPAMASATPTSGFRAEFLRRGHLL